MKSPLWCKVMILTVLAGFVLFAVSCAKNDTPVPPILVDPVMVTGGQISGIIQDGVRIYKAVPYAAPPVGDLRWKPPQPVVAWAGVRPCTEWSPQAPQTDTQAMGGRGGIDEDCLYLNLVTPAQMVTERLPVMVFFHGGGLSTHTANSETYNYTALPKKGVIVVTVNSRLGPIGYMAHPALTEESGYGGSGNYGTMDLIASLNWVKNNIAVFGGDPNNVTIFGESGGGTKVLSVMSSPLAKGLFHKAIIESGDGAISPTRSGSTLATSEAAGQSLQSRLGVTGATHAEVLAKMRAKTWQEIIAAGTASSFNPTLTIDGRWLSDTVNNIFKTGQQGSIPLIVGAQSGEAMLQSTTPLIASLNSVANPNTYVYVFSHLPPVWKAEGCVAFHGLELPYVFGQIPEGLMATIVQYLAPGGGCRAANPGYDDNDTIVAEHTMNLWSQFAKTGNPSIAGLVTWSGYTAANDTYLEIESTLAVKTGVAAAYTPPPIAPPAPNTTYTDSTYGFSVTYPEDWVAGAPAASNVAWRVGKGTSYIPSVRAIVRPSTEGADLQTVFTTHLTADGAKTITAYAASSVTINGHAYTKAEVTYASSQYQYDSMIIGRIIGGNWMIFEVYTVPQWFRFDTETQKNDILNSITFP